MSYCRAIISPFQREVIMAKEDIIKMSLKELKRLKVIQEVIDRHITQKFGGIDAFAKREAGKEDCKGGS
jgi:hypothetical protein